MEIVGILGLLLVLVGTTITLSAERGSPGTIFVLLGLSLFGWQFISPSIALSPIIAPNLTNEAQVVDAVSGLYQRALAAESHSQSLEVEKAEALAEKEKLEARVTFLEETIRHPPKPDTNWGWLPGFLWFIIGVAWAPAIYRGWDFLTSKIKARLNR